MASLKQKTLKGLIWSFVDQFGVYFIRFGFSIWIARLLSPEDFGLIGLMTIFIAVAQMFAESGLQMALIQKKDVNSIDFSTVFWFSLSLGLFFYILIFLFSEQIAIFFNEPDLKSISKVVSLSLIIGPFSGIQLTYLSRTINFKKQSINNFIATIFSGTIGVILAIKGFAVWALVVQTLTGNFILALLLWMKTSWRPSLVFDFQRFNKLYNYGWKIFLQGLSNAIFTNLYFPLIGKYYSTADLGFYTRGKRFYDLFILQSTISYGRVTFPVFSSIQDDKDRFLHAYIKTQRLLILIMIPSITILIATAEPFVRIFLTEKWMPAVPYIKMFYLMGLYYPIFMLNQNTFNAIGRSDLSLKIDAFSKVLLFSLLLFTYRLGIAAIIWGQIIAGVVTYFLSVFLIKKELHLPLLKQFLEFLPVLGISVIIYFFLNFLRSCLKANLISLTLIFVIAILLYLLVFKILNIKSYGELKELFLPYIPPKIRFIF